MLQINPGKVYKTLDCCEAEERSRWIRGQRLKKRCLIAHTLQRTEAYDRRSRYIHRLYTVENRMDTGRWSCTDRLKKYAESAVR